MSNTKTVMSQAANTQGIPLDITDVFSTYLYTGNGSALTINNGIDLAGEGGLVWLKNRSTVSNHSLHDTERTPSYQLVSNSTAAEDTLYGDLTSFNSDGFSLGTGGGGNNIANTSAIASWTFRKAPKFFDVVTYTGDRTSGGQSISHNLGTEPAVIIIKRTDTSESWIVYHKDLDTAGGSYKAKLELESTGTAFGGTQLWSASAGNVEDHTTTTFYVGDHNSVNATGGSFVAYLFAHNDGDGEFGPDGDQDIIKCGSYTGNGSTDGPEIDLGFEPQWLLVKGSDLVQDWTLIDTMRGMTDVNSARLNPNNSQAEASGSTFAMQPNPTGFTLKTNGFALNGNGNTYIYIAIRRGPLAPPESGTEVFAIDTKTTPEPAYNSGFVVDMAIQRNISAATSNSITSRLLQKKRLLTDSTNAEENSVSFMFDYNTGWSSDAGFNDTNNYSWMWKRAPGFFDVVAYSGFLSNGASGTIPHNLSVAPELMIFKNRSSSYGWYTWHTDLTAQRFIQLNSNAAETNFGAAWATADENNINIGFGHQSTSLTGNNYIAYLFATVPGVSKVFSVTKSSGSDASVDCGFTSGPRFVMLKRTDSTGDWYVWDTERGIVAGNDPYLLLNSTAAEVTSTDYIDPTSNGFTIVNGGLADGDYIGYAVS